MKTPEVLSDDVGSPDNFVLTHQAEEDDSGSLVVLLTHFRSNYPETQAPASTVKVFEHENYVCVIKSVAASVSVFIIIVI